MQIAALLEIANWTHEKKSSLQVACHNNSRWEFSSTLKESTGLNWGPGYLVSLTSGSFHHGIMIINAAGKFGW